MAATPTTHSMVVSTNVPPTLRRCVPLNSCIAARNISPHHPTTHQNAATMTKSTTMFAVSLYQLVTRGGFGCPIGQPATSTGVSFSFAQFPDVKLRCRKGQPRSARNAYPLKRESGYDSRPPAIFGGQKLIASMIAATEVKTRIDRKLNCGRYQRRGESEFVGNTAASCMPVRIPPEHANGQHIVTLPACVLGRFW